MVPWVDMQCAFVAFPDHTQLLNFALHLHVNVFRFLHKWLNLFKSNVIKANILTVV